METLRQKILNQLCYTELVYNRINKKLKIELTKDEIEKMIFALVADCENQITQRGKNYYIIDQQLKVSITVNSCTFRVITADTI